MIELRVSALAGVVAVDEARTARIGSLQEGLILSTLKQVGDSVGAGQLLATMHGHAMHDAWAGYRKAVAARQRAAYPDIQPIMLAQPPAEAFKRVDKVAMAMGWDIVARAPADGRLEAVDSTMWFGFHDDIVVRIRPEGSGSRIDVRSKSRVWQADLGVNASRIRDFTARLKAEH